LPLCFPREKLSNFTNKIEEESISALQHLLYDPNKYLRNNEYSNSHIKEEILEYIFYEKKYYRLKLTT